MVLDLLSNFPCKSPHQPKKKKKHPKFSNSPFSLLAELDHDS
jgi:hypothetical protein